MAKVTHEQAQAVENVSKALQELVRVWDDNFDNTYHEISNTIKGAELLTASADEMTYSWGLFSKELEGVNFKYEEFLKSQDSRVAIAKALELGGFLYDIKDIDALNAIYIEESYRIGASYTIKKFLEEEQYGKLNERLENAHEILGW
jgi:hypothetical protein